MGEEGKILRVVVADSNIIHCTGGDHIIQVRSYTLTLTKNPNLVAMKCLLYLSKHLLAQTKVSMDTQHFNTVLRFC